MIDHRKERIIINQAVEKVKIGMKEEVAQEKKREEDLQGLKVGAKVEERLIIKEDIVEAQVILKVIAQIDEGKEAIVENDMTIEMNEEDQDHKEKDLNRNKV